LSGSCDDQSSELACSDKGAPVSETIGPFAVQAGVPIYLFVDGFESQLATNHLGPFLLTGLLLRQLASDGRVVTVSSLMHRFARKPPLGDPHVKAKPTALDRLLPDRWPTCSSPSSRPAAAGVRLEVSAHAAHPGYAGAPGRNGRFGRSSGGGSL
jgi:NAD(P)-dependent dehydrogenase (short-subunit alcohol dehydrogenase family)